ncbi:Gfo/Idh/MocA family oxidoreductase [Actinoallomurus liliacearum]|uniref:Gfo/Idh/MocA family oxidoreductase n=1 Tax=Actinoallomurus liliacearum TaxID=1080073 RepID=A0ABP8TNM9_9ACTN
MTAPLRIGLVGYGFGGRYFHAPLLASAPECAFLGVVTTSPERRKQVAAELDRPAYASLEELAAAGAEAVAISTPADTHLPLTRQALELGLAVVCDKPFALDAGAARETVELAERLGVALTVYQNRRWDSDFRTLRRLVDAGTLGTLTRFESRFERFAPDPGPPAAGGGTLLDFGSHLVDQALVLCGPVERVYAEWHVGDGGLDDDVFVALTHRDGARSHLWGSWRQGAPGPRFRASGTAGAYLVDGVDGQEAMLLAGASPASEGDRWGAEPEEHWGQVRRGDHAEPVPSERGRWDLLYPAFAAAVRGTGPLPVDPWDAVATATVLDAAHASVTTGDVVRLP